MPGALIAMAHQPPKERHLSWSEVDWIIEVIVSKMRQEMHYIPKRIIPIGGGGIIPAGIMAYRFYKKDKIPIELMSPVYAKSYTHDHKQEGLNILWPEGIEKYDQKDTLFVDDIVDTGTTWRAIRDRMPCATFFALVTKLPGPHIWGTKDTKNEWWVFPWEKS